VVYLEPFLRSMSSRIVIADDHCIVRLGLQRLFDGSDFTIHAVAESQDALIDHASDRSVQVVVMEVHLGGKSAIDLIPRLREKNPQLGVLFYSASENPVHEARAMAATANGFLNRANPRDRLLAATRIAAGGGSLWSGTDQRRLNNYLRDDRVFIGDFAPLTRREEEILIRLTTGATNKDISDELKISAETVKEHVQHALRKIGVNDRTQAAVWAVRNGLA
jgi:DNA-binding NarL/FixJ family response regulator